MRTRHGCAAAGRYDGLLPELPEVEYTRRQLQRAMAGARIRRVLLRRPNLRYAFPADFARRLEGQAVRQVTRRAKYLLVELASGDVLLMHLGMSGSFRVLRGGDRITPGKYHHRRSRRLAHDHVVFYMANGAVVTFNDPRRFGMMKLVARSALDREPLLRALGPEPLGNAFDAATLARACRGKRASLKAALSDQRVVAGLGNIYVCEALHRARLSPRRPASTIGSRAGAPNGRAQRLVEAIKAVLADAIAAGGSSLRDHRRTDGELGDFQHDFRVYDRAGRPCPTPGCKGAIRRIVQGGRSTFFCPVCQR